MKSEVLIIGAGLCGLLLAYTLKKKGISIKIIEARQRIGGRIHTKLSTQDTPIEMGATWLHSEHQALRSLLKELELPVFEQSMQGITLFQSLPNALPQHIRLPDNQQASYRIQGGTSVLINKLREYLTPEEVILDQKVTQTTHVGDHYEVLSETNTYYSKKIVSTVPPQLFVKTVQCTPSLPSDVLNIANKTHTWMGESIKFGITFPKAFWKEKGFSGTAFSNIGPITEIYDHSTVENTSFALKGFLQNELYIHTREERKYKVLEQLIQLFGDDAQSYLAYEETVWKKEIYTAIDTKEFIFPHQNNGHFIYQHGFFNNTFFIGGSETATIHGGYMEGAVQSALFIYQKIIAS